MANYGCTVSGLENGVPPFAKRNNVITPCVVGTELWFTWTCRYT